MWIRLDDNITEHPKFLAAGSDAGWLWLHGLAYCNRQLTDGFIPTKIAHQCSACADPISAQKKLVDVGLWEVVRDGFRIHDFHDWNPTAKQVKARKSNDRKRKRQLYYGKTSARNPRGIHAESARNPRGIRTESMRIARSLPDPDPDPVQQTSSAVGRPAAANTPERAEKETLPTSASKRPIFVGQRFVVFDWQLERLMRVLGPHSDSFDLHEWFFTLDARLLQSQALIPQRDNCQWLEAQTVAEAQRRGLSVAGSAQERLTQLIAGVEADLRAAGRWEESS